MRLLQRYILLELLRVFGFLVSVLTVLLVFLGIFREVSERGLGPFQVLQILPYVVPSLLPFTIPATLLLTVCVVYGRMAGDREVTAAKAAGINVLSLLWPSALLGIVFSLCSLFLTDQMIPWAVGNIHRTVTMAMEDIFLDMLRRHHQVTNKDIGVTITVMDVKGKKLIMPTFQYTPRGHSTVTVQAQEATLEFDLERDEVVLHLVRAQADAPNQTRLQSRNVVHRFPLPREMRSPKPRHLSIRKIKSKWASLREKTRNLRDRRNIEAALALPLGDFDRLFEPELVNCRKHCAYLESRIAELRTEIHSRFALASSCLWFTLLGAPFAILQARRQFLTIFFLCFLPILVGYYPLVLGMMNLCKSRILNPAWAMWVGNALVLIAAAVTLRKVLRH